MPTVPELRGPSVAPSAGQLPRQSINTPQEAFGASVAGNALHDLGQALDVTAEQVFQRTQQQQALTNKTVADKGALDAAQAIDTDQQAFHEAIPKALAADPSAGPKLLADFYSAQEVKRAAIADNLNMSPMARAEYETASRRYLATALQNTANFTNTQRIKITTDTAHATVDKTVAQMGAHPNDPQVTAQGVAAIYQQADILGDTQGWTPEVKGLYVDKALGGVAFTQVQNYISAGDNDAATRVRDENVDRLATAGRLDDVNRQLSVGRVSKQANTDAAAFRTGSIESPITTPQAPQGAWDVGVKTFRADPKAALDQYTNGRVVVNSGARSPEHNAAVGGSPTSEHLTNTAWDFTPLDKNLNAAATTLASNLHAAGIPFDQIEVDQSNNHVHVGFGPKNRNELIDASGHKLASGTAVPGVPLRTPTMSSITDPDEYLIKADEAITKYVDTKYPNDPAQHERSYSAMTTVANHQAAILRHSQELGYTQAAQAVIDGNVQDFAQLPPSLVANLPPKYLNALKTDIKRNANEITPARSLLITDLEGKKAVANTNPEAFLKEDIPSLDLPPAVKLQYMKAQADIKGKVNKAKSENSLVTKALSSPNGKSALSGLGIVPYKPSASNEENAPYFQFVGALQSNIEAYTAANGNKAPDEKAMASIITQTAAVTGAKAVPWWHFGIGGSEGTKDFAIPEKAKAKIIAEHPQYANDERALSYIYHNKLTREARNAATK